MHRSDTFVKIVRPGEDAAAEAEALRAFGSDRAARVLDVDPERGRLVLDRVEQTVLHGDLHYGNILSSHRAGYVLIDPKGVIGEPAFDTGYLVTRYAPSALDGLPVTRAIDRRLAFLPDALGLDSHRVAAYAYVAAVLSMTWAVEDGDAHAAAAFAEVARILQRRS